jgi:DNA-directed RNA polymerase subunit RPC12/RpoP
MIYKCKNCGSAIQFDPTSGKLTCGSCGSSFAPEECDEILGKSEQNDTIEQKIYCCSACGAELMINDVESATFCAFCGQPTIVYSRVSKVKKPDEIIPFAITKEQAWKAISEKLGGFFVPRQFRNIKPDLVRGIYIPYAFSEMDYEGRMIIKGVCGSGEHAHTEHFYRHVKGKLSRLPIDLSEKFDDNSAMRLEPFGDDFREFDASYLSGYYADCGDEKEEYVTNRAKHRTRMIFENRTLYTVEARDKEVCREETQVNVENVKHVLVPVWCFIGEKNDERFTILVNGKTGEVVGTAPPDRFKMFLCALALFLLTVPFVTFIFGVMMAVSTVGIQGLAMPVLIIGIMVKTALTMNDRRDSYILSRKLTKKKVTYDMVKNRQEVE